MIDKIGTATYSLVLYNNNDLSYYAGYFKEVKDGAYWKPVNTNDYTEALKIPFKDEAQRLCIRLNLYAGTKYIVEEHMYAGQ